jgi:hypothetical protein
MDVRTLQLAGLPVPAELLTEAVDPAPALLKKVADALKAIGFKKKSAEDTKGVKRMWLVQSGTYDFGKKEDVEKFHKDLQAKLEGSKLKFQHKNWAGGSDEIWGPGFSVETQDSDMRGMVVVSVPKSNKSGDLYRSGIDA